MDLTPSLILCNDYELIEPIGHGGMGAIWRAKDLPGKREVALKFVPRDVQNFESEMDRVEDVFAVIEKLHHQHICPLYAMKDAGGTHGKFLVMQFIPGLPLGKFARQVRRKTGDFTVAQLVSVLRPIASALDYAHSRPKPVIHRDIKPANILVVTDDDLRIVDVQLIDFGIAATFRASLTRVSQVQLNTSGTRPYMAPEQWDGAYQNAATDQYALGITAYELLSGGQFPFDSEDFQILKECVKTSPVPPIETLSRAQNAVLCRALAKKREERFPTCTAFIDALAKAPSENFESLENESTINTLPPSDPFAAFFAAEEAKDAARRAKLPELALDAYQSGKHTEAAEFLREFLKYYPENENAKRLLARCKERQTLEEPEEQEEAIRTTSETSFMMKGSTLKKFIGTETEVVIPAVIQGQTVTEIGESAFNECESLISVVIPKGVTKIGGSAFSNCISLTSVVIPESVKVIGNSAFDSCSSLTSVVIPEGVTKIGYNAFFDCISLTSVVIPEGVKVIGDGAFDGCRSLTSVVIPEGVTKIEEGAFSECRSLTSVVIPASVTEIEEFAFDSYSKDLVIYTQEGAEAQKYAQENGIRWEILVEEKKIEEEETPQKSKSLFERLFGFR